MLPFGNCSIFLALPTVTIFPSGTGGFPGSTVDLDCTVTGFPVPRTSWLFNGTATLPSGVTNAGTRLTIVVDENTNGEYTCEATNTVGQATDTVTVSLVCESFE